MKYVMTTFSVAALLCVSSMASAACNTVGCWSMEVEQYRATDDGLWVLFRTDTDLSAITACTVKSVWFGGARKGVFVSKNRPIHKEVKEATLLSKVMREPLGFRLYDNPATSAAYCEFEHITVEETE